MFKKIEEFLMKHFFFIFGGILISLMVVLMTQEPKPEPPPKVQEIVLEDGTKCVVLKGAWSAIAISCNWKEIEL